MNFFELHQASEPLLLANVWDAASAKAAEAVGFTALGTSSAAIADMLGYADGEGMCFADVFPVIKRIRVASTLPLSVDMEAGYGETVTEVIANLQILADLGVVGVNLEDSVVKGSKRRLQDAQWFAERLGVIRTGLQQAGVRVFLNIRTDTFLLGTEQSLVQTIERGRLYADYGADGLFVPCVTKSADIATIVAGVNLPLNVMCMPDLSLFAELAALGVKRISMGNFLHVRIQEAIQQLFSSVKSEQSFKPVFRHAYHR